MKSSTKSKKDDNDKDKSKSLLNIYQDLMVKYPFYMNATQGGVINALSSITSQYISSKVLNINWYEVLVTVIVAITFITPIISIFYNFLGKVKFGGNIGKLFIDQAIFSPIFTIGIISYRLLLLGQINSITDLITKISFIAPSAISSSWMFWIPVRYFTLLFIPSMYQQITTNICAYLWNILFNLILSK